jgi:hypothetical protein
MPTHAHSMAVLALLVAVAVASGCGAHASGDRSAEIAPPCTNPAPLNGRYDPEAPGYIVVYKAGTDERAETDRLARQYGFVPRHVYDSTFLEGFAADLTSETVAALRCEPVLDYIRVYPD